MEVESKLQPYGSSGVSSPMNRVGWWSRISLVQRSFPDKQASANERLFEARVHREERRLAHESAFCTRGKKALKEKLIDVKALRDWRRRLDQEIINK